VSRVVGRERRSLFDGTPMHPFWLRTNLWSSCLASALVLVTGCRDATAPRVHPLTGVYDFTTVLDSVSYETSGLLGCGSDVMYCVKWRADSTGVLSGRFEIADSVGLIPALGGVVYGEIHGDVAGLYQGQAVTASVGGYANGPLAMSDATDHVELVFTGTSWAGIYLVGTFRGDSLVGQVSWSQEAARHPTTYRGTFVARRHP
jgi:hypothetical protein